MPQRLLRQLRPLGSAQQPVRRLGQSLPTEEEIQAAQLQQEEEADDSILGNFLRVPGKIFGGELVKDLLATAGEGGDLGEAFLRSNPITQIASILDPFHEFAHETDFADVRESGIFGDSLNVESKIGQLGIDLLGELVTSPLELLWTPFGKVPAALRSGAKVTADLGEAVAKGQRALFAFKYPFTDSGFVVPAFKSFDVPMARALQGVANQLNTHPVTSKLLQQFNPKQVVAESPEVREGVAEALRAANISERAVNAQYLPQLANVLRNSPELFEDADLQKVLAQLIESGVTRADSRMEILSKIRRGRGDAATPVIIDRDLSDTVGGVSADLPSRPQDVLEGRATVAGDTIGAPQARGTEARADIAEEALGRGVAREAQVGARVELHKSFRRMFAESTKIGEAAPNAELLERVKGVSEDLRALMDDLGESEVAAGLLRASSEFYLPRDISPEIRAAINKQWSKFDKTRKLDEMTVAEANAFLQKQGTKATGFRSVDAIQEGTPTVWDQWAKIFPPDFIQALKRMGPDGEKAAEFFQTNPADVFAQRIRKSAKKTGRAQYEKLLLSEDSPVVAKSAPLRQVLTGGRMLQEQIDAGRVGVVVRELEDGAVTYEVQDATRMLTEFFDFDATAKAKVADLEISRWADNALATGEKTAGEVLGDLQQLSDLNVRYRNRLKTATRGASVGPPEEALRADVRRLRDTNPEVASTIRVQAERAALEEDLVQLLDSPWRNHPLANTIKDELDILSRWDEAALDGLSSAEKAALSGDTTARATFRQDVISHRQSRLVELKATRNELKAQAKDLRQQIKSKRSVRRRTPEQNAEIADLERRLEGVANRELNSRTYVDLVQSDIKRLKSQSRSADSFLRDARKRGEDARNARLSDLRAREAQIREGIDAAAFRYQSEVNGFVQHLTDTTKLSRARVQSILAGEQGANAETSKKLNDLMRIWRSQKENGITAIQELQKRFPDVAEAMLQSAAKDARVSFIDGSLYDEVLNPQSGVWARLNKPDTYATAMRTFDRWTGWWKAWTVLPPVFMQTRARDVMTNVIMQIQGGVSPSQYARSMEDAGKFSTAVYKFLKHNGDEAFLRDAGVDQELLTLAGVTSTRELFEKAHSHGVINHSLFRDESFIDAAGDIQIVGRRATEEGKQGALKQLQSALYDESLKKAGDKIIGVGADFAEFGDSVTKLAGWFGQMRMGRGADEAAQIVRSWSYDPRLADLSHFERYTLRRFIPFYGWMKEAVRTQTEAFLTRPGSVTPWEKTARSAARLSDLSPAEYEAVMPEFIRDNFGIPTEVSENGTISVRMFGDAIPLGTVARLVDAIDDSLSADPDDQGGAGQFLAMNVNPWIKTPIELAVNESAFTQRPIEQFPGQHVEFMGASIPAKLRHTLMSLRLLNEIDRLNVVDASQLGALLGQEEKDVRDLFSFSPESREGDTSLAEQLLQSAFSPLPARGMSRDIPQLAEERVQREEAQRRLLLGRMTREEATPSGAQEDNLEALRAALAAQIARLRTVEDVQERFQR